MQSPVVTGHAAGLLSRGWAQPWQRLRPPGPARAMPRWPPVRQKLTRRPTSKPVELPFTLLPPVTGLRAPEPKELAAMEAPPELLTRATVA